MKKCIPDNNCSLNKAGIKTLDECIGTICITECFVNRASSDGTKMKRKDVHL